MKFLKFSVFILFVGNILCAQQQKFTMAEAVNGLRSNLAVNTISQFSWLPDGKSYVYATKNGYLVTNLKTQKQDTLVSLYQLNKNLSKEDQFTYLPRIEFSDLSKGTTTYKGKRITLEKSGSNWEIEKTVVLDENAQNVTSLGDDLLVYTKANNLYFYKNGKETAITTDENKGIVNGQAVHRSEFGITGGLFPAPNNNLLAFYRMDESMVKDYPIIDWSVTPAENHNIKYPMAGGKSHEVTLGVYDFKSGKTIFLDTSGDPEHYLTAISWSPDAKYIFVGVLNRDQNDLKFNQYDAESGAYIKTIFEEQNPKYVEPQNPIVFLPNSNTDFIWQSQRSGFNHLYHYNLDKGLVAQITKGDWLVNEILGFNEKKKEIYFTSTKDSPKEKHLYRINWNNFRMQRLDNAEGVHYGILSKDGNWLYDTYSNASTPRKVNLINTQSLKIQNILTAENPLNDYQRPKVEEVNLKADDGTILFGKLIYPTDFDPNKKYPVIVYLYNGPHVQLVTNSFPASGNLWYEYMAQNGYFVFTMDGRGSSNRGLAFEQAVFRHLGEIEMKDQMKGVDYLYSLPFIDAERMGIHGWSFGGFMTTSIMLKYPEVFKAAVAGGPVIDWNMYEIMYTERYMDSPQQNPEGYAKANLLDKVQNLKGKLLMIHGAQDDVVVWQHSIKFLKAAVDHGVQLDYFVYPGHEHNVRGKDRVHLMQKITDYFNANLK